MSPPTLPAPPEPGRRLRGLRTWLDTHRDQLIIVICVLLGCWLTVKSSYLLA